MSNRLLVNPGTPQAWEIQLKPGLNRIGRGDDNDFTITHPSVSTHHCEITVTGAGIILRDLGSTNGTFVNRAPIKETKLTSGQHVQFGAVDMMFESSTATAASAPAPAPAPAATGVSAPPPPPPPPAPMGAGLRINRDAPPAHSAHSAPTAAPTSAPPPPGIRAAPIVSNFQPAAAVADDDGKKPNFALSLTGVILGAVLGAVAWHLIYRFTGWKIGFMALFTGCLAGIAPQLIGHYRSKVMGLIAAAVTLVAIFGAQYFNFQLRFDKFVDEAANDLYTGRLDYAKRATQATPTGSDEEIRIFLAAEQSFEEHKVKPEEVEAEEITMFKEELPELRDLASGKITKEQYNKDLAEGREALEKSGIIQIVFFIAGLGIFNIVNIFLGVGAAFMTAKGDS